MHNISALNRALRETPDGPDNETEHSVPLPQFSDISHANMKRYREQVTWLDNKDYQRDDHVGACTYLGIPSPDIPSIEGLHPAYKLEFYQPTAIKAMVEFEDSWIGGGVLAEDVGLGKTIEVIGLLLFRSNERRGLIKETQPVPEVKLTLTLVPCTLVSQWVKEIIRFTSRFHVVVHWRISRKVKKRNDTSYSGQLTRNSK
jgi:SNF2 family DNA or RNA helicase